MRTIEEHGAQHVHEIVLDVDAYNSVGEHLVNDDVQAKRAVAVSVLSGIGFCAIILAILL
ncbi:MAG: hypothetical protein AB7T06_07835 [Kofleriaceae bacterium]